MRHRYVCYKLPNVLLVQSAHRPSHRLPHRSCVILGKIMSKQLIITFTPVIECRPRALTKPYRDICSVFIFFDIHLHKHFHDNSDFKFNSILNLAKVENGLVFIQRVEKPLLPFVGTVRAEISFFVWHYRIVSSTASFPKIIVDVRANITYQQSLSFFRRFWGFKRSWSPLK